MVFASFLNVNSFLQKKESTILKQKILFTTSLLILLTSLAIGQNREYKVFNLNGFGIVSVPDFLDTLGQDIEKRSMLEYSLNAISKSGKETIEEKYQVDLTKMLLSAYDSTVYLFWPKKSLLSLLSEDLIIADNLSTDLSDFKAVPNILLQKKDFKYNSLQMKKFLAEKNSAEEFSSNVGKMFKDFFLSALPDIKLKSLTTNTFILSNEFPVVKVTLKHSISKTDNKNPNYIQNIYAIYKGYFIYILKFQFLEEDENLWKRHEDSFFKQLKLF